MVRAAAPCSYRATDGKSVVLSYLVTTDFPSVARKHKFQV